MKQRTVAPETEVIGQVMRSYIDNIKADVIRPLLEKHGLTDIDPDKWYPFQPWLDVIYELSTRPDFNATMIAVGLKVVEYAITPPEMKDVTLGQMLEGWQHHFYTNHRNGDLGTITTVKVTENYYKTIHNNIYPPGLNYGLAFAFAKTMLPPGTKFRVWFENESELPKAGEEKETVVCIKWD